MIITLTIILAALIVLAWGYSMFISWKATEGVPLALVESAPFLAHWQKSMRLTRRGWYATMLRTKQALVWSNRKAGKVFVKFFPKAAPVFIKRDKLTGLHQGPSSYFLKSISQPRKAGNRRLPRTKKMV